MARLQLAARTGTDPTPDFAQMVDEDLLQGRVIGESFETFLPRELRRGLPAEIGDDMSIISDLRAQLGHARLRDPLIAGFFELGEAGPSMARMRSAEQGLDYRRRGPLGLALQRLSSRPMPFTLYGRGLGEGIRGGLDNASVLRS